MPYSRLRSWVFVLSVVSILAVEYTRHVLLAPYMDPNLNTALAVVALVLGSFVFTAFVFRIIEKMARANRELLATTDRARCEAETLYQIGKSLASILDFRSNLHDLANHIQVLFGADWVGIGLLDETSRDIYWGAASGNSSDEYRNHRARLGQGLIGRVISTGHWLKTEDFPADITDSPESYPTLTAERLRAALAVPIEVRGNVFGAIMIGFRHPRPFAEHDVRLLLGVAGQAAIAIDNVRLYNQAQDLAILEERDRLAREMHDSLAQSLSFINLKAETAELLLDQGQGTAAREEITKMKKACSEAYADLRQTIFSLKTRLGPNLDFFTHLAEYLHEFGRQTGIEAELILPQEPEQVRFSSTVELQLLRIIQEALTNVRRHAQVTRATVKFQQSGDSVTVLVADDGVGFNPDAVELGSDHHFGLDIMRERAEKIGGHLAVNSSPGCGTHILVTLPLSRR